LLGGSELIPTRRDRSPDGRTGTPTRLLRLLLPFAFAFGGLLVGFGFHLRLLLRILRVLPFRAGSAWLRSAGLGPLRLVNRGVRYASFSLAGDYIVFLEGSVTVQRVTLTLKTVCMPHMCRYGCVA
jgi:hypothetical protein